MSIPIKFRIKRKLSKILTNYSVKKSKMMNGIGQAF